MVATILTLMEVRLPLDPALQATSSAPRSKRGRGAPSPPSVRPRRLPTPGPSSSGYSHTASDEDSHNPSAARSRRRYTPYPSRRPTSSYPSPSIYHRPNPSFMRSRVRRRRAQISSPAGASDGDSDMEESGDNSDANVGAQQVGQPSQNSQPSVSDRLLRATASRFLTISEVERPIFCEPPPIPVLDTVDDLDGTLALPVFSAYSTPYYPPWSTTTPHPAPPGPHIVPWYPDIEHPDHSSMILPPLESNKDLPFGDLTLPPIRTNAFGQAGPSQQRLPSLFFPEVPNLSEYHRIPRSVRNQIRPLP
ncbi:hypothetical protein FA13DRAFT_68634 [Coprinellus micaceus]|uniref:Uncharacterized protein n=1 Tax=Coprinellus micaceus TaxID=71717 RepID=A0A4Y7TKR3_COPMI|nr:hypothetical protein FA13DRAFT_68634 [Coprinellus micaceus]